MILQRISFGSSTERRRAGSTMVIVVIGGGILLRADARIELEKSSLLASIEEGQLVASKLMRLSRRGRVEGRGNFYMRRETRVQRVDGTRMAPCENEWRHTNFPSKQEESEELKKMQGPCQILILTLASGWFVQLRMRHFTVLAALACGICLCRTDMNPSVSS